MNKKSKKLAACGISGNKGAKGIKHGHQGRNIESTEHNERMGYESGTHPAYPGGENNNFND